MAQTFPNLTPRPKVRTDRQIRRNVTRTAEVAGVDDFDFASFAAATRIERAAQKAERHALRIWKRPIVVTSGEPVTLPDAPTIAQQAAQLAANFDQRNG